MSAVHLCTNQKCPLLERCYRYPNRDTDFTEFKSPVAFEWSLKNGCADFMDRRPRGITEPLFEGQK